jgi:hypothetical protein
MKFWPLSVIAANPLVPPAYAQELRDFNYHMPSQGAYWVAVEVASRTQPVQAPNLAVIGVVDGSARRIYLDYPNWDEWFYLERSTVIDDNGYVFILMDALH